ncbi:MAG: DNA-binding HxlR family transcriptional regulator [Halioglobus sp.]|jgi:DNA-binding HxlR family transcriptional regulator
MNAKQDMRSGCAIANALDILGDRWTMIIIRDLMFTNRNEFGHMLNSGEGISTNILSERLARLQCHSVITKEPHPDHGKKFCYSLTDKGRKLAPTLIELSLWATDSIDNTMVPPVLFEMMKKDRKELLRKVNAQEAIVILDL